MEIVGNYPTIIRQRTGLFSLDVALAKLGDLGIPLRALVEMYGYPGVGKSTLAYYLSGVLAGKKDISLCDLEMLDTSYLPTAIGTSYSGTIHIADVTDKKGKPIPHEEMLMKLASDLYDPTFGVAMLDSVGGIIPIAEAKGDLGEAFMGRRAKLVAQLSRSLIANLRNKEDPAVAFIINHVYAILGAGKGHVSAGGDALKFLAQVRLMLWAREAFTETDGSLIGSHVRGQVEKNRYGGKGRKFSYYIIPNYGVHTGASAMFDAIDLGIAERDGSGRVRIGGKSLGYISADLLKAARDGNQRKFDVFEEEIQKYEDAWISSGFPSITTPNTESTSEEYTST